jgi:hypothetical protein
VQAPVLVPPGAMQEAALPSKKQPVADIADGLGVRDDPSSTSFG